MSLSGRGVVVTRPRGLAEAFAAALERRGARALVFPAIEIEELPAPARLARLADYDYVIFISPTAVRVALPKLTAWPPSVTAAAIGSGTRRELERFGVPRILSPQAGADSEALLAVEEMKHIAGKEILVVRGVGGRAQLGDALEARGAQVHFAECYRRLRPSGDAAPLLQAWREGRVDAVTVSSAEGFDNFVAMVGAEGRTLLSRTPLFVPHARVAQHARTGGEVVVAGPGDDETIERLVAYFHGRT